MSGYVRTRVIFFKQKYAWRNILNDHTLCENRRPTWNVNNPSPNRISLGVYHTQKHNNPSFQKIIMVFLVQILIQFLNQ